MITSQKEMMTRALSAFGATQENVAVLESEVGVEEKCIPYVHSDASPAFRFRINTNFLAIKIGDTMRRNRYINTWDLYHSQKTNQLFKAISVWPDGISG